MQWLKLPLILTDTTNFGLISISVHVRYAAIIPLLFDNEKGYQQASIQNIGQSSYKWGRAIYQKFTNTKIYDYHFAHVSMFGIFKKKKEKKINIAFVFFRLCV